MQKRENDKSSLCGTAGEPGHL